VDAEAILAFRLARSGLVTRDAASLAEAAACPASDFARDAALQALAARADGVTRDAYDDAIDGGSKLVVAHVVRGAIHALAADDLRLLGRALISSDDDELGRQLGRQMQKLAEEKGFRQTDALAEVAEATRAALKGGRALSKNELHDEYRGRVNEDLMPWCKGCKSHHVASMLWRYAVVEAGARLDFERRYLLAKRGRTPPAADALRLFLRFYAPATPGEFAEWAGIAKPHAARLWDEVEGELTEVQAGRRKAWALIADEGELESPPQAEGVVMIPPGDPYLQKVNRPLVAPAEELRKRLFRPVASPGAVLKDGRLAGLWRARAKGKKVEIAVEKVGRLSRADVSAEASRLAELRGAGDVVLVVE
jgi:Winged helix DNA-binding domain